MRSSWTFSRKLALGFAVIVVALAIAHEVRSQLGKLLAAPTRTTRETEAGATQTSSQLTSLSTSLTRLVQTT